MQAFKPGNLRNLYSKGNDENIQMITEFGIYIPM